MGDRVRTRHFRDLLVWQKSMKLARAVYRHTAFRRRKFSVSRGRCDALQYLCLVTLPKAMDGLQTATCESSLPMHEARSLSWKHRLSYRAISSICALTQQRNYWSNAASSKDAERPSRSAGKLTC